MLLPAGWLTVEQGAGEVRRYTFLQIFDSLFFFVHAPCLLAMLSLLVKRVVQRNNETT
jgi:hypothetical protein